MSKPKPPKPHSKSYTVSEAAAVLNCSRKTVLAHIASGQLPSFRLGERLIRIPAGALTKLVTL